MNKFFFLTFLFLHPVLVRADDIDGLIDKEKADYQAWLSRDDELPPTLLWPYRDHVLLYISEMDNDPIASLCSDLPLDQLSSLQATSPGANQYGIDFSSAKIRELWGDACLIRPGDSLMAVGPGYQSKVTLNEFLVEDYREGAGNHAQGFVTGIPAEGMLSPPFFFSSDATLSEGDNEFVVTTMSSTTIKMPPWNQPLASQIKFFDEYEGRVYLSTASNFDAIAEVKKKVVMADDIDLPSEMIVMMKNGQATPLIEEKVESHFPTGHVSLLGWFDFNHDGYADLMVEGDHHGCVYQQLFLGSETGLSTNSFPRHRCLLQPE